MKAVIKGRGEGKTTELLRFMLEPGNEDVVYLTFTNAACEAAWSQARRIANELGVPEPERARFRSVRVMDRNHQGKRRVVIDNLEDVLGSLIGRVEMFSLTEEDS